MILRNQLRHTRALLLASIVCLVFVLGMPNYCLSSEYDHHYQSYDVFIKLPCLNSVWQEVPEYQIASSNFTPGKRYLLVINFSTNVNNGNYNSMARVLHGTTPFPDSTFMNETRRSNVDHLGHGYHYWTVWTAVANEDIHIEISQSSSVSTMVRVEEYEAFALDLDDGLVENTDWFYLAATHPLTNLPTTWGTYPGIGASITFDGNNDDWMILGFGRFLSDATAYRYLMRIYDVTTGLDYSQVRYATEDTLDYRPHMIMAGITNVGSNHTVRVEAKADVVANDWSDSKIFALNMDKFRDHWTGYATNGVPITGSWPEVYGKPDYSASLTGNVLIWSQEIVDVYNNSAAIFSRMTVDGAVVPTGHADSKRELPHGNLDEDAHHRIYLGTLNAGSRDIDIDMYDTETTTAVADIHSMCIFSMEKANRPPTLDWTNDTNFESDGVDPDSALGGSTFEFRVEYTDEDGTAPSTKEVWVDLDDSGTYESGEKFDMSVLSGSDYTVGVDYNTSMSIDYAGDGTLKYKFDFSDGEDSATGTPTTDHTFVVENNPPTLDWTNDTNFESDGVHPDGGNSGSSFEFRVEYTDADNNAPETKELWVDLNDDNDYDDPGEKVDMAVLSGSDYTVGVDYSTSMNIDHAGDGVLKYKFNFSDGADSATGDPTLDDSWYLTVNPNNVPTLDWTAGAGYATDGVEPNVGNSGSSFEFRVEYTDADGVAPTTKQVWVDLDDSGTYEGGEKFDMTVLSGSDYTLGVDFNASVTIFFAGDGTLNYRFYFRDSQDDATGNPALDNTFTVNPNNVPTLTWTGDTGYTTDGVEPDVAIGGSTFEFRVKYTDADNHSPTVMQVWIDLNDDNDYDDPNEKSDMAKMSGEGNDYTAGVKYDYSRQISFTGDGQLNYRFYFTDGQDDATGDPTTNKTLTVTNNAPTLDWTGDPGFEEDGVKPNSANSGFIFGFRVEYTDLDNQAPTTKEVWIDLDDSSSYEPGEQFDMIELDPGDTNYQDGKDYSFSQGITHAGDGTLDYQFYFSDSEADATGDPTTDHSLVVTPNSEQVFKAVAYGGSAADGPAQGYQVIQQTQDGGYVVSGETSSFGAGQADFWVLKLNPDLTVEWEKSFGTNYKNSEARILHTQDGGYVVGGMTSTGTSTGDDFWVFKLNSDGSIVWQNIYGTNSMDMVCSIQEAHGGGYIVAGSTISTNPDRLADFWVLKIDIYGSIVWQKQYGTSYEERLSSLERTQDGGYILTGSTGSLGAGLADIWAMKLDSDGGIAWQKTITCSGTSSNVCGITQTFDECGGPDGYILAGDTSCFGAGSSDLFAIKLNLDGNIAWQKAYGSTAYEAGRSIQRTQDGGYVMGGYAFGGLWVLRLNSDGSIAWQKAYGGTGSEWGAYVRETLDDWGTTNGYIAAGRSWSFGAGESDILVTRLDKNGEIPGCSAMSTTSATSTNTSFTVANTTVTPLDTSVTPLETSVSSQDSSAATSVVCSYTPFNLQPVAVPGDNQLLPGVGPVTFDGSGSYDPDGNYPLTYKWVVDSSPPGSSAAFTPAEETLVNPTFTADVPGEYQIKLKVWDSLSLLGDLSYVGVRVGSPLTLDWTGAWDDGVEPNTGSWGDPFEFRVTYTDPGNDPPSAREVWIDTDDSGTFEPFEKFSMNEVNPFDFNYTDGKDYTYTRNMTSAGDQTLKYRFSFKGCGFGGGYEATGDPSLDDTWYFTVVADNPPSLDWTGEENYMSDGLDPEYGQVGVTTFTYRIEYTHLLEPSAGYPKVHILYDGSPITGSPFIMSEVDNGDTNYLDGKLYDFETLLPSAGHDYYTYKFDAETALCDFAVGDGILETSGPADVLPYDVAQNLRTEDWYYDIQLALDDANAELEDTVQVITGYTYRPTASINIPDGVTLVGDTAVPTSTTISFDSAPVVSFSGASYGSGLKGFTVRYTGENDTRNIDGRHHYVDTGDGASNITIDKCLIGRDDYVSGWSTTNSLYLATTTYNDGGIRIGENSTNITISNCKIRYLAGPGIELNTGSNNVTIENNHIYRNILPYDLRVAPRLYAPGIALLGTARADITFNKIYSNNVGIGSYDLTGTAGTEGVIYIEGNTIHHNNVVGIGLNAKSTSKFKSADIVGNHIYSNGGGKQRGGLRISYAEDLKVRQNIIANNNRGGIYFVHIYNAEIDNNEVYGTEYKPIRIYNAYDLKLRQNYIHDNGHQRFADLDMQTIRDLEMYNNRIHNNDSYVYLYNLNKNVKDQNFVYKNIIETNRGAPRPGNLRYWKGLYVNQAANTVFSSNIIRNSTGHGLLLRNSTGPIDFRHNKVCNNTRAGLLVLGSLSGNVFKNLFVENNFAGMRCDNTVTGDLEIYNNTVANNNRAGIHFEGGLTSSTYSLFHNIFAFNTLAGYKYGEDAMTSPPDGGGDPWDPNVRWDWVAKDHNFFFWNYLSLAGDTSRRGRRKFLYAQTGGTGGTGTDDITMAEEHLNYEEPENLVVVDNPDGTFTGDWGTSDWAPGYYGTDYHYHDPGTEPLTDTFTWTLPITEAGTYEIFARWTEDPTRAPDATYTVYHDEGNAEVPVNQQTNGGMWNFLGKYSFDGVDDYIELVENANGLVIADAIMVGIPKPWDFSNDIDDLYSLDPLDTTGLLELAETYPGGAHSGYEGRSATYTTPNPAELTLPADPYVEPPAEDPPAVPAVPDIEEPFAG